MPRPMEELRDRPLIRFSAEGSLVVGTLTRPITSDDYERFREAVHSRMDGGDSRGLVLDMANVDQIDSAGIGLILSALRRMREGDQSLALANVSSGCMEVLRLTNLHSIIPTHPSVEEAQRALSA